MNNSVIDEEIIRLIETQYNITIKETAAYGRLWERLIDEDDKELLNDIMIIKSKHLKMLSELYRRFKGEKPKEEEGLRDEEQGGCLSAEIRKAALGELENAETYRSLTGDFLNQSVRDSFTEIMTDCQNNAQRLSLLLIKYS